MKRIVAATIFSLIVVPALVFAQTNSCPSISKNLSLGSRGAEVVKLQQFLASQSLLEMDSVTGYFGKLTQTAVQQWQKKSGIVSSGSPATTGYGAAGAKTRKMIASACGQVSRPPPISLAHAQSAYIPITPTYAQSSYATGYSQGSYQSVYSQGTYYSQGSYYAQGAYTTCTPDSASPQTQTQACSAGQTGSITQTRTSSCASGATSPTWSAWTTSTNSCAATVANINVADPSVTSIKLTDYVPLTYRENKYATSGGTDNSMSVYFPAASYGLQSFYNQTMDIGVPGTTIVKEQRYNVGAKTIANRLDMCLWEYDFWQVGNDGSVTEAGSLASAQNDDTINCHIPAGGGHYFTQSSPVRNTGLTYSKAGTLTSTGEQNFDIQSETGNIPIYIITRLEAFYPKFKPDYGRCPDGTWAKGCGKTYDNVALVTYWHGTDIKNLYDNPAGGERRCTSQAAASPSPLKAYYQPISGYNSYAWQQWVVPGIGVIGNRILYFETGASACQGAIFSSDPTSWVSYPDDPS